jgi:hypothetical protein
MIHCLLAVAVVFTLLLALGVEAGTIVALGVALACPLMMVFMMGGLAHGAGEHGPARDDGAPDQGPASGAPAR